MPIPRKVGETTLLEGEGGFAALLPKINEALREGE